MSSSSLTEAVKLAATSMTDAVRAAAKDGADCTVISFPSKGVEPGRHQAWQNGRRRWAAALGLDTRSAPASEIERQPAAPALDPASSRRANREPWRVGKDPWQTDTRPIPSAHAYPLGSPVPRLLAVGSRLAGIAVLSLLSLVAAPSAVGPDRPALAPPEKSVALVIGNSAYRYTRKLQNPRNDASDISAALRKLGFQVIEGFDLDKAALERKISEFTALLRGAGVGAFFYAGHGLHASGHNYLVPVDAKLGTVSAVEAELVRLDRVHRTMEREVETNILFFDACRDYPLPDNITRAMETRSAEIGRGLAIVESGAGTLISFATQPGKVALDGKGRNSPYSAALVRQLLTSNDDLVTMLIAVRKAVMAETDGKQIPWEHSALTRPLRLAPAAETPVPAGAAHLRSREASEAWSATKDTTSIPVLEAFVARYWDTHYAELARARIRELRNLETTPHSAPSVARATPSSYR